MSEYPPAKVPTPADTLEEQITNSTFPKNEREWWASREIDRLRAVNAALVEALEEADSALFSVTPPTTRTARGIVQVRAALALAKREKT